MRGAARMLSGVLAYGVLAPGLLASARLMRPSRSIAAQRAPVRQKTTGTFRLENSRIRPMYHGVLVDRPGNGARVASLDNVEILKSRQQVEASQGQLESAGEAVLPVIGPGVVLNHLQGVDINNLGMLQAAHFTALSIQRRWSSGR